MATYTQVDKIAKRFAAAMGEPEHRAIRVLADVVGRDYSSVYRWTYPDGTDGLVPNKAVPDVLAAAERNGVELSDSDWRPL